MAIENQEEQIINETPEKEMPLVEEVDYKTKYEEAQKAIEALVAKKDQLLKETKEAKEEKRKQAQIAQEEKQKQLEIAQKNGEYEKLWKHEQEEKARIFDQLQRANKERRDEKIRLAATQAAIELARGDANKAGLLSEFLAQSISKVADDNGHVENDVLNSVKQQFAADERYSPLMGGNKSVGGGAPGNSRGAQKQVKEITTKEFLSLDYMKQRDFVTNGGIVVPDKN